MINHARTLLLNAKAAPSYLVPGEEFISGDYVPTVVPSYLQRLRDKLFGFNPDRYTLNYRTWQFMQLLHSCELSEFVKAFDSRVTYETSSNNLFSCQFNQPTILQLFGDESTGFVGGDYTDESQQSGIIHHEWHISVINESQLLVSQLTHPKASAVYDFDISAAMSSTVPLIGSTLNFRFAPGDEIWTGYTEAEWSALSLPDIQSLWNPVWAVSVDIRPTADLGQLVVELDKIGEPIMLQLFGVGEEIGEQEPFKTFRNLWYKHKELPYRLGAVLLAMIYQTHYLRVPK